MNVSHVALFAVCFVLGCSSSESGTNATATDAAVDSPSPADAPIDSAEAGPAITKCGNVPILGPQGAASTAACVACVDASCCAEGSACGANASCSARRACYATCTSDDCFAKCRTDHPEGAAEDGAFSGCRVDKCGEACADLACVGAVSWPAAPAATRMMTFTLREFRTGEKVANATIKVCKLDDAACASPLSSVTTDPEGVAKLTAPTAPSGFDAYFEIAGSGLRTTLNYVRFAAPNTALAAGTLFPIVISNESFTALTAFASVTVDETRGHVAFLAEDCGGFTLPGASASVASADASSKTAYITPDGLPSTTLTSTTRTGFGAIVNVPAGDTTFTSYIAAGKTKLGSAPVHVRAGAITTINAVPTP